MKKVEEEERSLAGGPGVSPHTGQTFDETYAKYRPQFARALDLDNDKYYGGGAADRINNLFSKFVVRRFIYNMSYGGFEGWVTGPSGDCKTLSVAFQKIAQQEFNITVNTESETTEFLTDGRHTIDRSKRGNCDNAEFWFFQNHWWVEFGGTKYDLLFNSPEVDQSKWDKSEKTGKLTEEGKEIDREYYILKSNKIVWENQPGPFSENKWIWEQLPFHPKLTEAGFMLPEKW